MMPGLRQQATPPSSAMRTSVPGSGLPTVPVRYASPGFTKEAAEDSVRPYPSRMWMPAPAKK